MIFLLTSSFALIPNANIKLFAITESGEGIDADLYVNIANGQGNIWSSIDSLVGTSTQSTEKTAIELLEKYNFDYLEHDYYFSIKSSARVVDGPSAGLPTALLLIHMIKDKQLPEYVSGTGTISSSGNIGKVGGILEKTKYAAKKGIKIFFIPKSELEVVVKEDEVKKVNLSDYAYDKYGIKVIGIDKIDEVFKYNLEDINDIPIEQKTKEEIPIYVPKDNNFLDSLAGFYTYLTEYQNEVQTNIDVVDNALKNSDLEDNDLLTELYSAFTDAKTDFDAGKSAYEKKYLYTAANHFFNANIFLNLISDILLNEDYINDPEELNKLADNLLTDYNKNLDKVPCNGYEWHIAAQERYLWARARIDSIKTTLGYDKATNISRLKEYEDAKEWLKISKLFLSYTLKDNCYLDSKPYIQSVNQIQDELSKTDSLLKKYPDLIFAEKWLNGSKDANKLSWHFASIYDGATALAYINSFLELKDKNLEYTKESSYNLIEEIKDTNSNFIWVNLYLQQASYLYNEGEFYEEKELEEEALTSYKSAYQIALFSKNLLQVTEDIEKNKSSISYTYKDNISIKTEIVDFDIYKILALILIIGIIIMFVIIIIFYQKIKYKTNLDQYLEFVENRIRKIKLLTKDIEEQYKKQKISYSNYKEILSNFSRELSILEQDRKEINQKTREIESIETILEQKQNKIEEYRRQYNSGNITHEDYINKMEINNKEVKRMKRNLEKDLKELTEKVLEKPKVKK